MNIAIKPIHPRRFSNRTTKKTHFVIHWPVMRLRDLDDHFTRSTDTASYHYCIGLDGRIHQYVGDNLVAHHAGSTAWNNKSIGIALEGGYLENGQRVAPSRKAHDVCAELIRKLAQERGIVVSSHTVKKHSEVRPHPTACPGSTDVDYIIKKASINNEEDMNISAHLNDKEYESGKFKGKDFVTRYRENTNLVLSFPRAYDFSNSRHGSGWTSRTDTANFEKFLEWWASNKTYAETIQAFSADYSDWEKRNPVKNANRASFTEGLAEGKKMANQKVQKDLAKYLEGLV